MKLYEINTKITFFPTIVSCAWGSILCIIAPSPRTIPNAEYEDKDYLGTKSKADHTNYHLYSRIIDDNILR